jgi:uncharacterized protein (TIGR02117 family)
MCLCVGGCTASDVNLPQAHEPAKVIYVVGHGWHTSLVVKRADIPAGLWPEQHDFPQATYIDLGWGDKDFYQAREPTLGLAMRAAFKSTGSVLHVVGFNSAPAEYFPGSDVFAVRISPAGLEALSTFIQATYKRDAQGRPMLLGKGWYGDSRFYLAEGQYHLFNTCNNWVARALQVAGAPINPALAMTAGGVLSQVRQFGVPLHTSAAPGTTPEAVDAPP